MPVPLSCTFLYGLFGIDSPVIPVWGDQDSLSALAHAVNDGFSISHQTSQFGASDASYAADMMISRLQKDGTIPADLNALHNLSDQQLMAQGYEAKLCDDSLSVQDCGSPHFKTLEIAQVLHALRRAARFQEIRSGEKPTFQVGILTMTVQGIAKQFVSQIFPAEIGEITHTVWLYRWCVIGDGGQYQEHWRTFDNTDGLREIIPAVDQAPAQVQTSQQLLRTGLATPISLKRKELHIDPALIGKSDSPDTWATATPTRAQKSAHKKTRFRHYDSFPHETFSHEQLLALEPGLLQGPAILRLAEKYSNSDIFTTINTRRPGAIASSNVITKRLTHAILREARSSGRRVKDVRAQLAAVRTANGVSHKMKVDVGAYGQAGTALPDSSP